MVYVVWYEVIGFVVIVFFEEVVCLYVLEDVLYKVVNFVGVDIGSISNLMLFLEFDCWEYLFVNYEVCYILIEECKMINNVMYVCICIDIYLLVMVCYVE